MITWAKQQSIKPIAANSQKRFTQVEKEVCDYEISNLIGQKLYSQLIKIYWRAVHSSMAAKLFRIKAWNM